MSNPTSFQESYSTQATRAVRHSSGQDDGKPLRILFVADTLGCGGKERQLVELLKGLDQRTDVVYSLCLLSHNIHYEEARSLNGETHFIERKFRYDPSIVFKLYSICRQFRPDILQSWELMCSIYALPVVKALGVKFVNYIQNAPAKLELFDSNSIRSKLTFPFSDLILANSYAGLRSYNIPEAKGGCIYNGFDFARLQSLQEKLAVRKRFDIRTEKVVGMVAKFHPKKDNETFLQAAMSVCDTRKDVTFMAVGEGVNLERCKKMVGPEYADQIKFLGRQEQVESIVNVFNIGVLATYTEGISNSIMEYMALSKPVIATDGGGTNELVIDNVTGFLVSVSDPDSMAQKVVFLLDHPEKAAAMGKAGRERLETHFRLERLADDFVDAYRKCLNC